MDRSAEDTVGRHVTSAGGVVYRHGERGIEVVLCARSREGLWVLPKGSPLPGEDLRETALREVREETVLSVKIEQGVGAIHYQFLAKDGTPRDKTVEHYLMVPTGGDLADHDGEFDVVRWTPVGEAFRLLRYPNERDILRKAVGLIESQGGA